MRHATHLALPAACLWLVACASTGGYPNHAAPAARLADANEPAAQDSPGMYLELIRRMQQQGAYYASLAHIDAFRQRYGDPAELQRLRADALRETGQTAAAEAAYRNLLGGEQAAAAWHGLGLLAAASGQYRAAAEHLQQAVEREPINATYLGDLGYAWLCAGQLDQAREPLAKAAELEPSSTKAISNLALWAMLHGDAARAESIMQRADLPASARDAVYRLANQLRQAVTTPAANPSSTPVATTASTPQPAARSLPRRVPPPQIAGIPGSMLERFGAPADNEKAHP